MRIITLLIRNDTPRPWGLHFQNPGTAQMEGILELHDYVFFLLIIVLYCVSYILTCIL
jgi:cytochrome c oxidase subunit 2